MESGVRLLADNRLLLHPSITPHNIIIIYHQKEHLTQGCSQVRQEGRQSFLFVYLVNSFPILILHSFYLSFYHLITNRSHSQPALKCLQFNVPIIKTYSMNGQRISFTDQNLNSDQSALLQGTNTHFQHTFKNFLKDFSRQNVRVYHRLLSSQAQKQKYFLQVQMADLKAFEQHLYERIVSSPLEMLTVMQEGIKSYVKEKKEEFSTVAADREWQVCLRSDELPRKLRDINSHMVSKIFVVSGIVITTTKPYIKARRLKLRCRNCMAIKIIELAPGQNPYIPSICHGQPGSSQKCPHDPFIAMPDSQTIDTQTLKLQECPEDVPTGEIARTYSLIVDRDHTSKCVPGDRLKVTGIMLVSDLRTENLSKGYIYVTGIEKMRERMNSQFGEGEEEIFKAMGRDPRIRERIYRSIAPGIYGNEEIKQAIACMLFGGSRKHLPDQTTLRGDINVLLIGDPSTAKSQFLKFVQQTAAIAVYTSGKGSSAAGLTASISKDMATGEFQIQGGALVLADGGIVCIDQFDKMKSCDRVAIHEAMQQQTISVAKAGITTRLNSRTSILAAANPIYGRYDEFKQIAEQIELQTTILSRFDCIFVVRDINTPENNQRIASHILDLHQGKITRPTDALELPFQLLKKYIRYARARVQPRLSILASEKMLNIYVSDRQKAAEHRKMTQSKNSVPITVRQLQALIRLSQALARMKLRSEVTCQQVDQAHHLFQLSTLKTLEGAEFGYRLPQNMAEETKQVEEAIKRRVAIGGQVNIGKLIEELQSKFSGGGVQYAIKNLVANGEFREIKGKKQLVREL